MAKVKKSKNVIKKSSKTSIKKSSKKMAKKPINRLVQRSKVLRQSRKKIMSRALFNAPPQKQKQFASFTQLKGLSRRATTAIKVSKIRHKDVMLVLDFGSQYTQLIARRIRENKVFSKIVPYNITAEEIQAIKPKGLVLSGGPLSVYDQGAARPRAEIFKLGIPVLGICYGMQVIGEMFDGKVEQSKEREFGRAELFIDNSKDLFVNIPTNLTCWMSHGDQIKKMPQGFVSLAHTLNAPVAAFANRAKKIYGVQFHPEVVHTQRGSQILANFLFTICGCLPRWTMDKFIDTTINEIKTRVGKDKVILGLSGGVDSSVAAVLLHRALGGRLHCVLVDNGLMRKNEAASIQKSFANNFNLHLTVINAEDRFLARLKGVTDPEQKRKIIGDEFVKVFTDKAKKIKGVKYLAQGTLYPDVIESQSVKGGPSEVIKTHHNVGGLPKNMKFELVEPFRELFKDEVRSIGKHLGVPDGVLKRQPFPGPGLAIRVIEEINKERLEILREADDRVVEEIKKAGLYNDVWQSFAVLLPVKTVGVMGDKRTYENVIAVRCVSSSDGMTADWVHLPYDLLARISNRIINEVRGVNRVVYDISSKPPATIEWE